MGPDGEHKKICINGDENGNGEKAGSNKAETNVRSVRTVKMYTQEATKDKHTNSPSSLRRMKMEVNPLIYESEPLI